MRRRFSRLSGYTVWRIATTLAVFISAGALLLAPFLFNELHETVNSNEAAVMKTRQALASNHALLCTFANLVQLAQNPAPPTGSVAHLEAQLDFLLTIRRGHCEAFDRPRIAQALNEAIRQTRDALERKP